MRHVLRHVYCWLLQQIKQFLNSAFELKQVEARDGMKVIEEELLLLWYYVEVHFYNFLPLLYVAYSLHIKWCFWPRTASTASILDMRIALAWSLRQEEDLELKQEKASQDYFIKWNYPIMTIMNSFWTINYH